MAVDGHLQAAAPAFKPPPGTCDCHCHIFGSAGRYATVALAGYTLPVGPLDSYLAMAGALGFERRVFVQPAMYGTDSGCILDALRRLGSEATRGIGGIPAGPVADVTLAEWHDLGIRGMRLNYTPYKPYEAGFAEAILPEVERAAALARDVGWMLDVMTPCWLTMELLPYLDRMRIVYTLGHFGKFPAASGTEHPAFKDLLSRFANGDGCWIKLCAAYQISDKPGFSDIAPVARARRLSESFGEPTGRISAMRQSAMPALCSTFSPNGSRRAPTASESWSTTRRGFSVSTRPAERMSR